MSTAPDARLEALRREVATAHGLGPAAVPLITGETVEQVEATAARLARVLNTGNHPEPKRKPEPPRDVFAEASAAKAQRKRELAALFSGRPQPRDELGRFAATSFDGGARRATVPRRRRATTSG